ncbi:hypothetical protein [Sphingomonas koreensis]|uniref:hypothetical protein n=1 Tax=Sphingomonas koreensis TaxID=93064 RepID=UPI000B0973D4|nr:hypothetical protein [Sphingomonas koreensis]
MNRFVAAMTDILFSFDGRIRVEIPCEQPVVTLPPRFVARKPRPAIVSIPGLRFIASHVATHNLL